MMGSSNKSWPGVFKGNKGKASSGFLALHFFLRLKPIERKIRGGDMLRPNGPEETHRAEGKIV